MGKGKVFDDVERLSILGECDRSGNVSSIAKKYGITRATIYSWKKREEEIRKSVGRDEALIAIKETMKEHEMVLGEIERYSELLAQKGALERRKQMMSGQVEFILWNVIKMLEVHPDLAELNPKDLSRVMVDLHNVRKELSNEPTVIIEYRNEWMEKVLMVMSELVDEDKVREFVERMEAVEAEYQVL